MQLRPTETERMLQEEVRAFLARERLAPADLPRALDDRMKGKTLHEGGRLADVTPTALHMMGIAQPAEMTGRSLIG